MVTCYGKDSGYTAPHISMRILAMTRKKKSRSLKGKLNVKTGSKKNLINSNDKGKIPSKNKLSKHKKRQKSSYQKHLDSNPELKIEVATKPKPEAKVADTVKEEAPVQEPKSKSFDDLSGDDLLDLLG